MAPRPIRFSRENYVVEGSHGPFYEYNKEDHNPGHGYNDHVPIGGRHFGYNDHVPIGDRHFGSLQNAFTHRPAAAAHLGEDEAVMEVKETKKMVHWDNNNNVTEEKQVETSYKVVGEDIDSVAMDFIRRRHESFERQRLLSMRAK